MFFTNIISNLTFARLIEQKVFKVTHRFEDLAKDEVAYFYFSNPSGSTVSAIITLIDVVTQGQGRIDISNDFTIDVAGTDVTALNLFLGSTHTSSVIVKHGGTYSNITNVLSYAAPGGTSVRAVGAANPMSEFILVPPGNKLLIQFTNTSETTTDCSIAIVWIEAT